MATFRRCDRCGTESDMDGNIHSNWFPLIDRNYDLCGLCSTAIAKSLRFILGGK